jgi:hypothetical protein
MPGRAEKREPRPMLSLVLTTLIMVMIYLLQESCSFLAGVFFDCPVRVIVTSFIVYEGGGNSRLLEAITGMLGQLPFAGALFVFWLMLT